MKWVDTSKVTDEQLARIKDGDTTVFGELPPDAHGDIGRPDARIAALESMVNQLADALAFTMSRIQLAMPSPIAGAPLKTATLAQVYHAMRTAQAAQTTEPSSGLKLVN